MNKPITALLTYPDEAIRKFAKILLNESEVESFGLAFKKYLFVDWTFHFLYKKKLLQISKRSPVMSSLVAWQRTKDAPVELQRPYSCTWGTNEFNYLFADEVSLEQSCNLIKQTIENGDLSTHTFCLVMRKQIRKIEDVN